MRHLIRRLARINCGLVLTVAVIAVLSTAPWLAAQWASITTNAITSTSGANLVLDTTSSGNTINLQKLAVLAVGKTLRISAGTGGCAGSGTMPAGGQLWSFQTDCLTANSMPFITITAAGATSPGAFIRTITSGASFSVQYGTALTITSTINYAILNR